MTTAELTGPVGIADVIVGVRYGLAFDAKDTVADRVTAEPIGVGIYSYHKSRNRRRPISQGSALTTWQRLRVFRKGLSFADRMAMGL